MPLQFPEALHDVASVELQVRTVEAPLPTAVCDALSDTVGRGRLAGGPAPDPPQATIIRDAQTGGKRL
jgi:hypothetical protein